MLAAQVVKQRGQGGQSGHAPLTTGPPEGQELPGHGPRELSHPQALAQQPAVELAHQHQVVLRPTRRVTQPQQLPPEPLCERDQGPVAPRPRNRAHRTSFRGAPCSGARGLWAEAGLSRSPITRTGPVIPPSTDSASVRRNGRDNPGIGISRLPPISGLLDDFAMREFTPGQADDLYELTSERATAGHPLILTANRSPVDWYPLFPNPVVAESLLDRLINTSHQVFMNGPSYRPNKRPGTTPASPAATARAAK